MRHRSRPCAGRVDKDPIKLFADRKISKVRGNDLDVRCFDALCQQARAVLVHIQRDDGRFWIALGENRGLAARRGAGIEDARSPANQQCHQL